MALRRAEGVGRWMDLRRSITMLRASMLATHSTGYRCRLDGMQNP
jgi:hypothetical protein